MVCSTPIVVFPSGKKCVVPCGKCMACLSNKRDDWSLRLTQELKHSRCAVFVTLTYSNKYVPDQGVDKVHLQLFMKRLRKRVGVKLRYYAVGEYGSKTGRPHYHLILFNYDESEAVLQRAWSNREGVPFGHVDIRKVNEARIRYATKYVIQRVGGSPKRCNPPFALMSRRYGLGAAYLSDAMVSWHRGTSQGSRAIEPKRAKVYVMHYQQRCRLPRFYKDKIWPPVKGGAWEEIRTAISKRTAYECRKRERDNRRELKRMGYVPSEIIAEMRNAVMSRVRQKVSFTQIL